MSDLFQQVSLKTIKPTNNDEYEICNTKTELDSEIRCLLDIIYSGNRNLSGNKNTKYLDSHKSDIICFFRGFAPDKGKLNTESCKARYFQDFFIVGEKGKGYLKNEGQDGHIRHPQYFVGEIRQQDVYSLLKFVNRAIKTKKSNDKELKPIEREKIKPDIEKKTTQTYMFLLNFAHNIGGIWPDKCRSPLVSASYGNRGYDIALSFAKGKNKQRRHSYIIMGFGKKSDINNIVLTEKLTDELETFSAHWHKDIHKEMILKDCIFPDQILGVFEVSNETDDAVFIVNPGLYQLFEKYEKQFGDASSKGDASSDILEYICSKGIPIDQAKFDLAAAELGYERNVKRKSNNEHELGLIGSKAYSALPNNRPLDK